MRLNETERHLVGEVIREIAGGYPYSRNLTRFVRENPGVKRALKKAMRVDSMFCAAYANLLQSVEHVLVRQRGGSVERKIR